MRIDATTTVSKQQVTPEGYLLCADVTIARTGRQVYHISELPAANVQPDNAGMVAVERSPHEVFRAAAMQSFDGAPVVLGHPDGLGVDASNWRDLAVGFARNVRRMGDRLVADLVITDARAVDLIRNGGWRGVSCGYDAGYIALSPGRASQVGIQGNHVALLPPDQDARCGPLCSIGDAAWPGAGKGRRRGPREIAWGLPVKTQRNRQPWKDAMATEPMPPGIVPTPTKIDKSTGIPMRPFDDQSRPAPMPPPTMLNMPPATQQATLRGINDANRSRYGQPPRRR
jgi:hypothetical protein